ncbi:nucleotidyl transferase AbiEii/AbiGii toxin family protein [Aetokthonos hydrillicola Thurmond2011]|uniref:Nucleotidyl transferase AbiEii/AbiGii toxin family protein n=1 Tax=Aetokthonos hydrillicola Thurmond2011 TaxID=2712845 RepID=A0AAP5IGZ6_9CYAN|nr:nucleotidyl transferase AbiEii/AbiGii toxin family protein [Aetokthonos hydrillicola]MBO3462815.1 nucleotidyl transferase AbiEii/AbiGii toxin family protein [Aetokthonos hydrillicola CCALA 1050]MBW4591013.1 nucleotidyl transferase AbiEii/AbiGii toxin family protein [Aetokthonos hydrillicola CCALA 1050]MDR9900327.1 nucleotidyl transferase AbiEii/AbiGii toxin family protein [Aetokthonos hydrillicola Thurmond2011]
MNTFLDPNLVEVIASDLGVDPSFVEKDWYAMRIIASLKAVNDFGVQLVFAGGTSLSKGFGLIKRFSEDLDFKVILPKANPTRNECSNYRKQIVEVIRGSSSEWSLEGEPKSENANRKFTCNLRYKENFYIAAALRPYIKLEVNFILPTLPAEERSLQSFIAQAMDQPPEVPLMACVSPIETAAEKLSALTWRVLSRNRGSEKDDPSLIRHLYDLTALRDVIFNYSSFSDLVVGVMRKDIDNDRGRIKSLANSEVELLEKMLLTLEDDCLYANEYQEFVTAMSYALEDECPTFSESIDTVKSIISMINRLNI